MCERYRPHNTTSLLVERLGVGGGGSDVSVTSSLVRAGGELQIMGSLEVGVTRALVRTSVVSGEVEFFCKAGKHCGFWVKHCRSWLSLRSEMERAAAEHSCDIDVSPMQAVEVVNKFWATTTN